jgi:hypothetical protein
LLLTDILPFVMMRRVAAVLCVTALAGCGSEAEPQPLPPVASGSPSPAAALPVPPEATPESAEGAAAFARYWIQVLEQALATGDATHLRTLSDSGCGGCNNLIGAVESGAPGETIRGGRFTVEFAEAPSLENGETIVTLRYSRAAGELIGPDGTATPVQPEGPVDAEMRISRQGETWVVLGFRGTTA